MINGLDEVAMPLLKDIVKEAQNKWLDPDSKYKEYRALQIDKRGSFGERFFTQVLLKVYPRRFLIEYRDGDQGDWDFKFSGLKFEVKTSSIDVNGKFQNEGLKKNGDYDGILFLGVSPNKLYVKFVLKKNIPFDTLHNRGERNTGVGYKWDFKLKEMTVVSSLEDFKKEFEKQFGAVIKVKKK